MTNADASQNARDLATMAAEAYFDLVRIQEQRQFMVAPSAKTSLAPYIQVTEKLET